MKESIYDGDSTEYCKDCGYAGKGGFVHFFSDNMTLDQALCFYLNQVDYFGLYDDFLTSIALELMFYNENYQAGVIIVFEFNVNNAGNVDKYYLTKPFFSSRYDSNYHRITSAERGFLIFLDVIYLIGLIWFTYI